MANFEIHGIDTIYKTICKGEVQAVHRLNCLYRRYKRNERDRDDNPLSDKSVIALSAWADTVRDSETGPPGGARHTHEHTPRTRQPAPVPEHLISYLYSSMPGESGTIQPLEASTQSAEH